MHSFSRLLSDWVSKRKIVYNKVKNIIEEKRTDTQKIADDSFS